MGPHPSSSRCLTVSGSSGQYERGSMSEFGRELAILVPTVEKKLLNVLAISVLFVVGVPSMSISVILCVLLLRLAASLRISHAFLMCCWLLKIVLSTVLFFF